MLSSDAIEELRNIPIRANELFFQRFGDYADRKIFYQQNIISKIPVDNGHPLFNESIKTCGAFGLLYRNYYAVSERLLKMAGARQYINEDVLLRESILRDLKTVDQFLDRHGLRLIILSGYRHPELQRLITIEVEKRRGRAVAETMFANPAYYVPHASGAVFDIELWDEKERKMLPTKTPKGFGLYCLENIAGLSSEEEYIRGNRRIIHNVLSTDFLLNAEQVFVPHPFEYWHYGRNERLSAFFGGGDKNQHAVFYEQIYC